MTTIHAVTATQKTVDGPSGKVSVQPLTYSSRKATGIIGFNVAKCNLGKV